MTSCTWLPDHRGVMQATVVRGFAHHHWAQVYSESLSASTKASLGAMCEPARMQPTGAGGAMAGAMAHSVTVANFTACWEQAKPDLNMCALPT